MSRNSYTLITNFMCMTRNVYKQRNKLLNCAVKIGSDAPSEGQWAIHSCLDVVLLALFIYICVCVCEIF